MTKFFSRDKEVLALVKEAYDKGYCAAKLEGIELSEAYFEMGKQAGHIEGLLDAGVELEDEPTYELVQESNKLTEEQAESLTTWAEAENKFWVHHKFAELDEDKT